MHVNPELQTLSRNFVVNANLIRKDNNLSYRGMSRAAGVSDSTVRRIESARRTRIAKSRQGYIPSLGTVVKFAQAVGCSTSELLTGY